MLLTNQHRTEAPIVVVAVTIIVSQVERTCVCRVVVITTTQEKRLNLQLNPYILIENQIIYLNYLFCVLIFFQNINV